MACPLPERGESLTPLNRGRRQHRQLLVYGDCRPPASAFNEKVNGGGMILVPGGTASFSVRALLSKTGEPQGALTYQDHVTGQTVRSAFITAVIGSAAQARMCGKATINGAGSFDFVVDVFDKGEPGSAEVFRLQLSNGYAAGGTLSGGNIQVH